MIKATIPSFHTVYDADNHSYTVFLIEVFHFGRLQMVERRYKAFHTLHKELKKMVTAKDFPPKRMRNWNPRVLEQRRQGLEHYLQSALKLKPIPKAVLSFLELPWLPNSLTSLSAVNVGMVTTHQPIVTFVSDPFLSSKSGAFPKSKWFAATVGRRRLSGANLEKVVKSGPATSAAEVRKIFLDFFVQNEGHTFVKSSSVVPYGDQTLLFTNAGMNQFKPIFLGTVEPENPLSDLKRAVNSQKCIRVGGKHNDLDVVGTDGYHHTFFEMLGSWSFSCYFKEEACRMAWELLTGPYNIPPTRLVVTYFGGDPALGLQPDLECRDIWLRIGVPRDRVLPFGSKDNFWEMGTSGPCGPCTEIHYCHLAGPEGVRLVNVGRPEVIELWNLVFMQYNRQPDGTLRKLSKFHVDTGMGLERLVAILNGTLSNYDTDLFVSLFRVIQQVSGCPAYGGRFADSDAGRVDTAYRTIADHARMCAVSIGDGVVPDEIDAGHCLRKVIRRALIASEMILRGPRGLLARLLPCVVASLGDTYPEVRSNVVKAEEIVLAEEERFLKLLGKGLKIFREMCSRQGLQPTFSAENMWELFFVHGMPEDVIIRLCESRGLSVDLKAFRAKLDMLKTQTTQAYESHVARNQQKEFTFPVEAAEILRSKGISGTADSFTHDARFAPSGLVVPHLEGCVLAIWDGGQSVQRSGSGNVLGLVLDKSNFYAEAGGQVSDTGIIESSDGVFRVDTVSKVDQYVVHQGTLTEGWLSVGSHVELKVDADRRAGCTRNHTATHVLQAAVRRVLGETWQKSSVVAPNYLRFDFAVKAPVSRAQYGSIEAYVQMVIEKQMCVSRLQLPSEAADKLENLVLLPGAKYPDLLTVVAIQNGTDSSMSEAISLEACCGTHVDNTKRIEDFVILSQKSMSQTTRSVRAVTGPHAAKARQLQQQIEADVVNFENIVSDIEAGLRNNFDVYQKLGSSRAAVAVQDIPLMGREPLDKRLEGLKERLMRLIRRKAKEELSDAIARNADGRCLVHHFDVNGSDTVIFNEVKKMAKSIPSCCFVSVGDRIHCQCHVPKEVVSEEFTARGWAAAVMPLVDGTAANRAADAHNSHPTLFVFAGQNAHEVERAMEAAQAFVSGRVLRAS